MSEQPRPVIKLDGIHLEKSDNTILSGISFDLAAGQCCAVIGPNGSGKSSLISVIAGYQWPTKGKVYFHGRQYGTIPLASVRSSISLISTSRVPEFDFKISVFDVVCTGLFETIRLPINADITAGQISLVERMLASHNLTCFAARPFRELSTGEKMNVLICRAMIKNPALLLLDEPTAGLDIKNRMLVLRNISRLQNSPNPPAILIVSHHLSELPERLDKVCMLKNGRFIAQGAPQCVLTSQNLTSLFDCPIELTIRDGRYYTHASI